MSLGERFWSKVDLTSGDCWEWHGAITNGYGSHYIPGRTRAAHRLAWEELEGPIPDGLQLDHLCRNRQCVKPAHLEPVTNRVNALRGASRNAQNARKTRCVNGHEFTETNTYYRKDRPGHRQCRTCSREAQRLVLATSEEARQKNRERSNRYYYEKVRGRR